MGRRRGQRNRAREKVWAGQDASKVRDEKRGTVAQTEECDAPQRGASDIDVFADAGSTPAGPSITVLLNPIDKVQLVKREPETFVGPERSPGRRIPKQMDFAERARRAAAKKLRDKKNAERSEFFRFIQSQYEKSKVDLFKMICRVNSVVEYALPECWHELDPESLFSMLEDFDFPRFALAMGYTELEIRNFSRKA